MKEVIFLSNSLDPLRAFPADARHEAGFQIDKVQCGLEPDDWKPISTIGGGVNEIRIWDEAGTFRVVYVAKLIEAVFVLHCFQKKSQEISQKDIAIAKKRYKELMRGR